MSRATLRAIVPGILFAWGSPSTAHHGHGNYDLTHLIDMQGTVTEVNWINPHTWIYIEVANDDGTKTLWTLEGGSINALTQRGWSQDSVKLGDTISVRCHPLRGGTPSCLFGFLKTADGQEGEYD